MNTTTFIILAILGFIAFKFFSGFLNPSRTAKKGIVKVYNRFYRQNNGYGHNNLVVRGTALAETLKQFCRFSNKPYVDEDIQFEILPFVIMDSQVSVDVFSEYVLLRDGTHPADIEKIKFHINKVVDDSLKNNPTFIESIKKLEPNKYKWYDLIDNKLRERF
jgi:hypothetical protein